MAVLKENVSKFGDDAITRGGYVYTTSTKLSTRLSNERTTSAIDAIVEFRKKRVLDIGCGDGFFTEVLASLGASEIVAVDPSESAIKVAKKRKLKNVKFQVANLYDMDPKIFGQFDVVVLRGVIHHVSDAKLACQKACQFGSEVVGMEPNGANIILKIIEKTSKYHIEHEEKSYLPSTLDNFFESAGAVKVEGKMVNLVPIFSPNWLALSCKLVEPIVEAIPLLRLLGCGQYVFRYKTGR